MEVTDPAEPLFGRRFEVVSIARGDEAVAHVFVRYCDDIVLRVPLRSTSLSPLVDHTPRGKLSPSSVEEFLALVKEYELCPPNQAKRRPRKSGKRSRRKTAKKSSGN